MFKSIFGKYITAIMSIVFVCFLTLVIIITTIVNAYAFNVKKRLLSDTAHAASSYLTTITEPGLYTDMSVILSTKRDDTALILSSIASLGEDLTLLMVDTEGAIFLVADKDTMRKSNTRIPRSVMNEVNSGKELLEYQEVEGVFDTAQLMYAAPIYTTDGYICGTVLACTSSSTMEDLLIMMIKTILIGSLWIMLAAFVAVYLITSRIASPLQDMSHMAKRFAEGDYSARVPVHGRDEVAQLAVAFNNMADSVSRLEVMRNTFMANVSHDLRTPMTTISGFIDNILSGAIPPEKQNHYLEAIRTEIQRLARLVASLLNLSRIEAGDRKFEMAPFDVCEMARLILFSFEAKIEAKNLDVEFDCDKERMTVKADRDAIYQILYNICDNAVKFSRQEGKLRVRLSYSHNQKVCVSVYNEGEGIPAADLPFVFERFYKSDKSRGLDKSGVGLGMYIAKTIIDAHHEKIWVNSVQGEFCEFTFTLASTELPIIPPQNRKEIL